MAISEISAPVYDMLETMGEAINIHNTGTDPSGTNIERSWLQPWMAL